jgi:hypothetical protein
VSRFTYDYAECRYAECRGVPYLTRKRQARLDGPGKEKHSSLLVIILWRIGLRLCKFEKDKYSSLFVGRAVMKKKVISLSYFAEKISLALNTLVCLTRLL